MEIQSTAHAAGRPGPIYPIRPDIRQAPAGRCAVYRYRTAVRPHVRARLICAWLDTSHNFCSMSLIRSFRFTFALSLFLLLVCLLTVVRTCMQDLTCYRRVLNVYENHRQLLNYLTKEQSARELAGYSDGVVTTNVAFQVRFNKLGRRWTKLSYEGQSVMIAKSIPTSTVRGAAVWKIAGQTEER